MKNNGYKKQKELGNSNWGEVEVAISREGEVLFVDGRHRLSIAKILEIKEIPVIVDLWHKKYMDRIKDITDMKYITPKTAIEPIFNKNSRR